MDDADALPEKDPLAALRRDILAEASRRDKRVSDTLAEKMDAQHQDVMAAIASGYGELKAGHAKLEAEMTKLTTMQDEHSTWMHERDAAQAESDRKQNEQAQREAILADIAAKAELTKKKQRDRWARVMPPVVSFMGGLWIAGFVYILDNIDTLKWNAQTQLVTAVLIAVALLAVWIVRYGP